MFDTSTIIIAIGFLAALSVLGVAYAVFGNSILGKDRYAKRLQKVLVSDAPKARGGGGGRSDASGQRRKQIQQTLKDLEEKNKEKQKGPTLRIRLMRAGLDISPEIFFAISAGVGGVSAFLAYILGYQVIIALLILVSMGVGFPRWVLGFLTKRRQKAFVDEFANALDVVTRGLKAGLPVGDSLKIVANEAPEPVGGEFKELVDGQRVGVSMEQAVMKLHERMPVAEVNFFGIVLAIQQQTGGNLAEALENLANVLRDRKQMKAKVKAISSEAKSSAGIIGALPIAVMGMMYFTSHDYIMLLFDVRLGNIMLTGGGLWMLIGVLVMRKMIDFKI